MLWRLSLFLGGWCQLNNKINFLLLSIPDKSPKFILLWRYTSSYSFLHRASKHADLIEKSRTQLPTNAIKAINKATLDYGLWHDRSFPGRFLWVTCQSENATSHSSQKQGTLFLQIKTCIWKTLAVLRFCGSPQ